MAEEQQPTPVHAQIADLEGRLDAVESQASKEEQGWIGRFGRAGIVVGCLGGALGAVGAAIGLYQGMFVAPHVQLVFLGDNIEAHWDTHARRLSFDCWIVATNDGRADDTLRAAAARLWTAKGETLAFRQIVIKERGDGVARPVFHLDPNKQLDVLITVTSVLDNDGERSFRELGLYKLVLDFEAPVSRLRQQMTHCFWFREQAAGDLATNGSLALVREDSCEELQQGAGRTARN
jgi:hypothetical protein